MPNGPLVPSDLSRTTPPAWRPSSASGGRPSSPACPMNSGSNGTGTSTSNSNINSNSNSNNASTNHNCVVMPRPSSPHVLSSLSVSPCLSRLPRLSLSLSLEIALQCFTQPQASMDNSPPLALRTKITLSLSIYIYTHIHTYVCIHTYTCVYTHTPVYLYTCMCVYLSLSLYIYIYI